MLAGCSAGDGRPSSGTDPRLTGDWLLVSGSDAVGGLTEVTAPVSLSIGVRSAHGRGPCVDYSAKIIGGVGPVFVSVSRRATAERCEIASVIRLDDRYASALAQVTFARIDDGTLTLAGPSAHLTYARLPAIPLRTIVNLVWVATEFRVPPGYDTPFDERPFELTLLLAPNLRFVVSSKCPPITGRWTLDAGQIEFADVHGVTDACRAPGAQNRAAIWHAIGPGFQVERQGDYLIATNNRADSSVVFGL
jgi:hypothetical protein